MTSYVQQFRFDRDPLFHPKVLDWERRVRSNGGFVSMKSMLAVNKFYKRLNAYGIMSKMQGFITIVPDNIIAATTPIGNFIGGYNYDNNYIDGQTPWDVVNGPAILSVNGITGSVNNCYLASTVVPSVFMSNSVVTSSVGMTVYIPFYSQTGEVDIGLIGHGGTLNMYTDYNDINYTCFFDCFNNDQSTGRIFGTPVDHSAGYFSGNRLNDSDSKLYSANSLNPHYIVASGNTMGGNPLKVDDVPTLGHSNGNAFGFTNRCYSFAAIHNGLTEFESKTLYSAIQRFRQEIGGGYV